MERSNCLQNIRIIDFTEENVFDDYHYISFSDLVYSVWLGTIPEETADLSKHSMFETNIFRYTYTSLIQPQQVIDYNMDTRTTTVVHEQSVMSDDGEYDNKLYTQKRLFATGTDGTAIPMSIVYRKVNKIDLLHFLTGFAVQKPDTQSLLAVRLRSLWILYSAHLQRKPIKFIGPWVYFCSGTCSWWS